MHISSPDVSNLRGDFPHIPLHLLAPVAHGATVKPSSHLYLVCVYSFFILLFVTTRSFCFDKLKLREMSDFFKIEYKKANEGPPLILNTYKRKFTNALNVYVHSLRKTARQLLVQDNIQVQLDCADYQLIECIINVSIGKNQC